MAIRRSTAVSVTSASNRAARVAAMQLNESGVQAVPRAEGDTSSSTGKTPDYHLPWTGEVVEETLRKMMEFDPATAGGIIILASTSSEPANADTVLDPGNYTADFMTGTGWPSEIQGVTPTNLIVYEKDGVLYQLVEAMGDRYVRFSTDNGANWSVFSEKAVNTGGIDTSGEPDEPKPDPFEEMGDKITNIEQDITNIQNTLEEISSGSLAAGSVEEGEAMLDGTYDYDTNTYPGQGA